MVTNKKKKGQKSKKRKLSNAESDDVISNDTVSRESKRLDTKNNNNDDDIVKPPTIPVSTTNNNNNEFATIDPPLSQCTLDAITALGFTKMTPVQRAVIPLFLTNKDVSVQAVTGSGKTCAFVIPIIEMILRLSTGPLKHNEIGGLIISPTRELARQTYDVTAHFCKFAKLPDPILLTGGTRSILDDLTLFKKLKSDIIIATPGRLDDVCSRYDDFNLRSLEVLILDEADVLLDLGFEVTLSSILSRLPKMRRTGLFSATRNHNGVKHLVRAGLRNPVMIKVAVNEKQGQNNSSSSSSGSDNSKSKPSSNSATPSTLTNYYSLCKMSTKFNQFVHFIKKHQHQKCICFFLSCAHVEFYYKVLTHLIPSSALHIEPLHGKKVQKRREKAMERFRETDNTKGQNGKGSLLLCTDVAARGLDISNVEWVIQYDAPTDPASFVHRVGRSARAGKSGKSCIFLLEKEDSYIDFLSGRQVSLTQLPRDEGGIMNIVSESTDDAGDIDGNDSKMGEEDPDLKDYMPKVKKLVMTDRDVLEKGTKAFTSHIRAYKEHQCGFIFRFSSLNLGELATSFALLRLPKMPELKPHLSSILSKGDFVPAPPSVDIYAIPYLDKSREAARQKRLAKEVAAGGKNAKQIKAEQRLAEKARKEKERTQIALQKGLRDPNKKKKGRNQKIMEEWDELAKEERLHKKLRRGKITKEEYKRLLYGDEKKDGCNSLESDVSDDDDDDVNGK